MKKLLVIMICISSVSLAQESVELVINFEEGSDVPSMPEMAMLDEIAQHPNSDQLRFSVVGHTDDVGSVKFNEELSRSRTMKVAYHLLLSGIKPYNILFDHQGENCPLTQNEGPKERAENRRVEVLITNVGKLDPQGFAGLYSEALFQKPIKKVELETQEFVLNNLEPNCLETASGSYIDVPSMAFTDGYGRPIGGEVTVQFTEFSDPYSLFLSGIPLRTTDGRALETCGIFNLSASHRGKPVEVRSDRPIHVDLISSSIAQDFSLLFLDPSDGTWTNSAKAPINAQDAELIAVAKDLSPATRYYLQQTDYLSVARASRVSLEERFQNLEYLNGRPIASYYRFLRDGDEHERKQFESEWKKAASFEVQVQKQNPSNLENTVHFTVEKRSKFNQHPEFFMFNWYLWEYDGDLKRDEVLALIHGKRFQDVRVRYDEERDSVSLELKSLDGILKLPVKKVTVENLAIELQRKMFGEFAPALKEWLDHRNDQQFEARYAFYADVLAEQEQQISKRADRFDARAERRYREDLNHAWKTAQKSMTEAELMMSEANWRSHCSRVSNKLEEYFERQRSGEACVRSLSIDRTGLYNCARPVKESALQAVRPRFVLSDGSSVEWSSAYVFDQELNTVLRFDADDDPFISLDPANVKQVVITDGSGELFGVNESEVIAMNLGKVTQRILHVTELDGTVDSLEEMREMLGLSED